MNKGDIQTLRDEYDKFKQDLEREKVLLLAQPNITMKQAGEGVQKIDDKIRAKAKEVHSKLEEGYHEALEYIYTWHRLSAWRHSFLDISENVIRDLSKVANVTHTCNESAYNLPHDPAETRINEWLQKSISPKPVTLNQAVYNFIDARRQQKTNKKGRKPDARTLKEVLLQAIIKGRGYLSIESKNLNDMLFTLAEMDFESAKRMAKMRLGIEKRKEKPKEQAEYIYNAFKTYGAEIPSYDILKQDLQDLAPRTTFNRYLRECRKAGKQG